MKVVRIQLGGLKASGQPRPLVTEAVDKLAASIKAVGLIQPITVRPCSIMDGGLAAKGHQIIAGHHRVAACRALGWTEIDAIVVDAAEHLQAELMEIDENLCRAELTASQMTSAIKRRRQIWEALHPEGKQPSQVGTPVAKHGREQAVKFATDTAAVSGEGRSSIYRHLARADALGDDLDRIHGTSLDKGVEMDALKAMPEPERKELIDRAVAGEKVSARVSQKSDTKSPDMPTLLLRVINDSVERILATADARSILEFADVVKAIPEERRKRIEDALVSLELIGNLCEGVEA